MKQKTPRKDLVGMHMLDNVIKEKIKRKETEKEGIKTRFKTSS